MARLQVAVLIFLLVPVFCQQTPNESISSPPTQDSSIGISTEQTDNNTEAISTTELITTNATDETTVTQEPTTPPSTTPSGSMPCSNASLFVIVCAVLLIL